MKTQEFLTKTNWNTENELENCLPKLQKLVKLKKSDGSLGLKIDIELVSHEISLSEIECPSRSDSAIDISPELDAIILIFKNLLYKVTTFLQGLKSDIVAKCNEFQVLSTLDTSEFVALQNLHLKIICSIEKLKFASVSESRQILKELGTLF